MEKAISGLVLLSTVYADFGNLLIHLGDAELKLDQPDFLRNYSKNSISVMSGLAQSLTPEEFGLLMKVLVELSVQSPKLTNFAELTPDSKMDTGHKLVELGGQIADVVSRANTRIGGK